MSELVLAGVCVLSRYSWGVSFKRNPFYSDSFLSTISVHWTLDNRITRTPHEHTCRIMGTRRDKSVPSDLISFFFTKHTHA